MWRALFMGIGITLLLLGLECMVIHEAVLADDFSKTTVPAHDPELDLEPPAPVKTPRRIAPPEWAPWSLLSAGAVVVLYSFTVRSGNSGE